MIKKNIKNLVNRLASVAIYGRNPFIRRRQLWKATEILVKVNNEYQYFYNRDFEIIIKIIEEGKHVDTEHEERE